MFRREEIEEVVAILSQSGELVAVKSAEGDIQVYLEKVYRTEKFCAEKLMLLDRAAISIPIDNIEAIVENTPIETFELNVIKVKYNINIDILEQNPKSN